MSTPASFAFKRNSGVAASVSASVPSYLPPNRPKLTGSSVIASAVTRALPASVSILSEPSDARSACSEMARFIAEPARAGRSRRVRRRLARAEPGAAGKIRGELLKRVEIERARHERQFADRTGEIGDLAGDLDLRGVGAKRGFSNDEPVALRHDFDVAPERAPAAHDLHVAQDDFVDRHDLNGRAASARRRLRAAGSPPRNPAAATRCGRR